MIRRTKMLVILLQLLSKIYERQLGYLGERIQEKKDEPGRMEPFFGYLEV